MEISSASTEQLTFVSEVLPVSQPTSYKHLAELVAILSGDRVKLCFVVFTRCPNVYI
jgi:hypothetical protein